MKQISKHLGIGNKKYHDRLVTMFSKVGMHLQAENHKKSLVYRVWTPGKHNPESAEEVSSTPNVPAADIILRDVDDLDTPLVWPTKPSALTCDIASDGKMNDKEINSDLATGSPPPRDAENNLLNNNSPEMHFESRETFTEPGLDLANVELENTSSSKGLSLPLKHATSTSNQRQQSKPITVESIQRKKKILERLQVYLMTHYVMNLFA